MLIIQTICKRYFTEFPFGKKIMLPKVPKINTPPKSFEDYETHGTKFFFK